MQPDFELGTLAQSACGFDSTRMSLDDAVGERESEASAFPPGGVEGLKNPGQGIGRNAAAGIRDLYDRLIPFAA